MEFPNWRKIDKFYLSGGWNNLPENIKFLTYNRIIAVLDLQFFDDGYFNNTGAIIHAIKEELQNVGIDYLAIKMQDSELVWNLEEILNEGQEFLTAIEEKYPDKRDGILIKCAAGISRSPTMLINHLCISRRMSYLEALNYLRDKEDNQGIQFGSSPNYFFVNYLKKKFK